MRITRFPRLWMILALALLVTLVIEAGLPTEALEAEATARAGISPR